MATLTVPNPVPPVGDDCDHLHKAFRGWGTNEEAVISILAHRNTSQRSLIRQTYVETYGEDLLKALDSELSSDFGRAVHLWTLHQAERDALLAHEAVRKNSTNGYYVLLEIACTRSSRELFQARENYHARYKKSMEEDVAHHTTGVFRKLLVPLVSAYRYDGAEVNMTLAHSEAKILREKICEKAYNDEEIIRILTTRSKAQLHATLTHYKDQFGNDINKDLKTDTKEDYLALLRSSIKCLISPEKYFEKVVRLSIKRLGTDEEALTRVIVSRAEVDMKRVMEEYYKRNSVLLETDIKGDTSGDYQHMLLALIGHHNA